MGLDEYYRRLELPGTASRGDVKRAYRRLRAKYHPDLNKGSESTVEPVFKRVQEAFEILSGKRKPPMFSPAAASTEDSDKEAPSREYPSPPPMRGANCLVELFVPLETAIHGGEVEACYAVNGPCRQCQQRASECARRTPRAETGRPPESERCPTCLGTGVGTYRMAETVKVPAGAWDGQRLVVQGGGHFGVNGGPMGDAIFSVAIVCNSAFRRNGLDLACEIQVDFVTATLGGNFEAQILGRALQVPIPPNAQPGSTIRLPGHGLTDRRGSHGALTLQLVLAMPAAVPHLTDDERERLREIFADAERRAMRADPACSRDSC